MGVVVTPGIGDGSSTTPAEEVRVLIKNKNFTNKTQLGVVLTETLTEELDSMTIIISDVEKTLFEPFDDAYVKTKDGKEHYMYVTTAIEEKYDIVGNTYSYTINLISQTKILERVQLPNLKIRKPIRATTNYIGLYVYKVLRYIKRKFPFITEFTDRFIELTQYEECPEIEWNHPTAKQVLNDLLQSITNNPCLVRVVNNKIDYVSLAHKGVDIETYDEITIMPKQTSEQMGDFANNIVMDANNIIPREENIIYTCSTRAGENAYLKDDNCDIILPYPIESIKKVMVKAGVVVRYSTDPGDHETIIDDHDITKYILEENDYRTLRATFDNGERATHLYYTHGDNKIKGLNETYKVLFVKGNAAIQNIIIEAFKEKYPQMQGQLNTSAAARTSVFTIEYKAITSARIQSTKEEQESKDVSIYQGQNQPMVDYSTLMKSNREAVNRLGNESIIIPMVCKLNAIPQLGDYFNNDYILCQKQVSFFDDFALVNGTFTKNFIQKNIYYGLKTKMKYTQLAQAGEAVIREEYMNKKIVFSFTNSTTMDANQTKLAKHMAKFFDGDTNTNVKVLGLRTNKMNAICSIYPVVMQGDRSITISAQCTDNYSIAMKVESEAGGTGNYIQKYVPYVDEYGECDYFNIYFYTALVDNYNTTASAMAYPEIDLGVVSSMAYSEQITYNKDNGETLRVTYQFDFISSDDEIVIGDAIGNNNALAIGADLSTCKIKVLQNRVDWKYPVTSGVIATLTPPIEITNNMVEFDNSIVRYSGMNAYALVDANGEIILAVNRKTDGSLPTTIYISVKGENE